MFITAIITLFDYRTALVATVYKIYFVVIYDSDRKKERWQGNVKRVQGITAKAA